MRSPALAVAFMVGVLAALIAASNGLWWPALGPAVVAVAAAVAMVWPRNGGPAG